jgi:acetylornithine deacetylase/succinyl-diaminopimelate desuccinylase-like protein
MSDRRADVGRDPLGFIERELVRLIEIASFSGEEHEIQRYLASRAAELGLPVARQEVEGCGPNLVIGWSDDPELLLTAHVDTIRPTWAWDGRATVADGRVHGLGAQDDKGSVVAVLVALVLAAQAGVALERLPVAVGLTVDEERGGTGSIVMAKALRPALVLGLEGTGMRPGLAESGTVEVFARIRGRAVHGALRERGDNAIEKAIAFVTAMQAMAFIQREHPLLGRNVPMVWEFHGGSPLNVIPDLATVHLDLRVNPGTSASEVFDELQALCARSDGELETIEIAEPFETAPDAALPRALSAAASRILGRAPDPIGVPAWTDAHNFVDLVGSQAVVFGPGGPTGAHEPGESIAIAEVVDAARVLAELIADTERWLEP